MLKYLALVFVLACAVSAQKFPIKATAIIGGGIVSPTTKEPIMIFGDVSFIQETRTGPVTASVNITFFPATDPIVNRPRGIHVHTFGIAAGNSDVHDTCETAGPHWNPSNNKHGNVKDETSHEGDLGNVIVEPTNGNILTKIVSTKLRLFGPDSIIGRSVVLHETLDDLGKGPMPGSAKTGNSGAKIACGTIGLRS